MKLSFKTILPILLIFTLLILFAGCTTPSEEQPGYTPGTITGIIAAPCCSTSADPVTELCCVSPEYWCYYCQKTWNLQNGIEVVLTYGEDEVATVFTNKDGEFTFTKVDPGKNYVVTAYCPDFADNRPLVKDVALELIEGGSFDTKITDLVSTSLGLVVDFLVLYTDWGPEDISLDAVLADRPEFPNFPKFKALVYEVRRVVENCELNLLTDDDVLYATCRAAEEISGLDIGCGAGFTPEPGPGPTPTPGVCDGNTLPEITDVTKGGVTIFNADPALVADIYLIAGTPYEFCVTATDIDGKLPQPLTYSITIGGYTSPYDNSNCLTITPEAEDVGTYDNVTVNVYDGCGTKTWGPITVIVDCCPLDPILDIDISIQAKRSLLPPLCLNDCAIINSVTIHYGGTHPLPDLVITDFLNDTSLAWTIPAGIIFTKTTNGGTVCLDGGLSGTAGTYTISVTYTDPCGETTNGSVDVTFEDCSCVAPTAEADGPYTETVCPGSAATVYFNSTVTLGTGPFTYAWTFGDGGTSTDADPSHEYPAGSGSYNVTLVVTNACGDSTYNTTVTITGFAAPIADAGLDQCIQLNCESEVTVNFDGKASSGTNLTYSWDFDDPNDSTPGTGATPTHTYTAAGEYTVTLTVTDSCGSSDTDNTLELTVHSACGSLPAQLTISTLYSTISDYYFKVKFSDGGGDILSDTWYYGWCAHETLEGLPENGDVLNAYCTLELDTYWPNVNWIINNRSGYNKMEVQYAIWYFIHHNGENVHDYADGLPWWYNKTNVKNLINAALPHTDFCPEIGEKYVVLLTFGTIDSYGDLYKCGPHDQNIMIEVTRVDHCLLD